MLTLAILTLASLLASLQPDQAVIVGSHGQACKGLLSYAHGQSGMLRLRVEWCPEIDDRECRQTQVFDALGNHYTHIVRCGSERSPQWEIWLQDR